MWFDNETDRDFLNFHTTAETVAEIIAQAKGSPLSIGICGSWGVGKSSMLKLTESALRKTGGDKYVFVTFNAWLYQGYDDARAALVDVVARDLLPAVQKKGGSVDALLRMLSGLEKLRVAKLYSTVAPFMPGITVGLTALAHGVPVPAAIVGAVAAQSAAAGAAAATTPSPDAKVSLPDSVPKEIADLRTQFQKTLTDLGVTVVVFIDDLDRCLPTTAISTLEAIRLFLFMDNTAFVIAADDKMIRQAVKAHFAATDINDLGVTSYFDKLIQIPFRVPPLGTQDVRAYLMLLFIQESSLVGVVQEELRVKICKRLSESWQGKRVDSEFVLSQIAECPEDLKSKLRMADRLTSFLTTAPQISGNPRLIKRFLNTLAVRLSIAKRQAVTVDEEVLVKVLLFERCGGDTAYQAVITSVANDEGGKPTILKTFEEKVAKGERVSEFPPKWNDEFMNDWLTMAPLLADKDLRPALHVSRESIPLITPDSPLSAEAAHLLGGILKMTKRTPMFKEKIAQLDRRQVERIMDRVLSELKKSQDWGQAALVRSLVVIDAVPEMGERLGSILQSIPAQKREPSIIPLIQDNPWGRSVMDKWNADDATPSPVKKAIANAPKGNH